MTKLACWKQAFIYLTYPTEKIEDIQKYLNIKKHLIKTTFEEYSGDTRKIKDPIKIGLKIDYLKIIKFLGHVEKGNRWLCECECGRTIERNSYQLYSKGKVKKSCGCKKNASRWVGIDNIPGWYFVSIKRGAKTRDIEFNISVKYINELLIKQNFKCSLTNLSLKLKRKQNCKDENTASLDRIDSSKGYIEGNVQWVHKDIQRMKWKYDEEFFIRMCSLVQYNLSEKFQKEWRCE